MASNQQVKSILKDSNNEKLKELSHDVRIAFVGNVDSGKSSLIGTLMKCELDDGRGSARRAIFRHKHEADTGRTSSIATTYIGFKENGDQIQSKRHGRSLSWSEIGLQAYKKIQLIDLAGHEKYLKTTVFGLTGMQPDFVIVVIGANMGVKKMTKEHLGIAIALDIPIVIALTKIDIAPANIAKETMQSIRQYIRKAGKMPMLVKTLEQSEQAAKNIISNRICPIFPLSNVTGDGLNNLRLCLSNVKPPRFYNHSMDIHTFEDILKAPFELPIDETYQVQGAGFVIAGTASKGYVHVNDQMMIGPDHCGQFHHVTIRSIESMHLPLREAHAGQTTALSIRSLNKKMPINQTNFRKGMVLISPQIDHTLRVSRLFEARILILHHQTTISVGYQPVINCRTIRQTAEIISIDGQTNGQTIRTGDRALIRFRFVSYAEFMTLKARFVFRDGQAKGIGKIVRILKEENQ